MPYVTCCECGEVVDERDRHYCPRCGHSEVTRSCNECLYSTYYYDDGDYTCSFGITIRDGSQSACVHFTYDDSD